MKRTLLALALAASSVALAGESELDGKWEASWTTEGGILLLAAVEIDGASGTWRTVARSSLNSCIGLPHPLLVTRSGAGEIVLRALGSQALVGCPDFSVFLVRKIDDKTWEAKRGSHQVTFSRR